jgi:hypothetical protein
VHQWARRPFTAAGFLALIALVAAAGPWACIALCSAPTGAPHAHHHEPYHVIDPDTGDMRATSVAGRISTLAHIGHHPGPNSWVSDIGGQVIVGLDGRGLAVIGVQRRTVEIAEADGLGTIRNLSCPPGPTLTALTVAIILPAVPIFHAIIPRLWRSIPPAIYTSVDLRPPWPPPRTSMSFAI